MCTLRRVGGAQARVALPLENPAIDYLLVVPVRFHRVTPGRVAAESAFCEHVRMLRRMLEPRYTSVTLATPAMEPSRYASEREHLGVIDEAREGIRWVELHPVGAGLAAFWLRHFPGIVRRLWAAVARADLVHAGISHNLWRPVEFPALLLAKLQRKKTICVVDIDLRDDARMNLVTGRWSRKSYLLCRHVYDRLRALQLSFAARRCSLVLLKGRKLCRDYGAGRPHVRFFLDAAFSAEHVIPPDALARKLAVLEDPKAPLELVYFGRLTPYKGVDRCIAAVALAAKQSKVPLRLHVIGGGEQEASLRQLARSLGVEDAVAFHGALPFGPRLFEALYPLHLALAAPLSEDTPRSALDALASAVPILAFDTGYYADLARSGAVDRVPWLSVECLAMRIVQFAADKRRLIPMARAGVRFARANTQEKWLRSRIDWTLALADAQRSRSRVPEATRA